MLITGNSSGLGLGLSKAFLAQGGKVYGCSRRGCGLDGDCEDIRCDLSDFDAIPLALEALLSEAEGLDIAVLNAGMLGEIKPMHQTSVVELQQILDVNLLANKVVLDWLCNWQRPIKQIVLISSGAAVLGNKGWGGYALSKAALNMLTKLYSHEFPDTHLTALAPGLIDSVMMEYLCTSPDPQEYPALARLHDARNSGAIPDGDAAGEKVLAVIPELLKYPSGSFIDIRQINDPEEYARVFSA
ncbi:MAG: SDR family NAD(P)-dependent oxidoreductase [Chromatiales bacterium]|nr:SDR family NAD(P)-dependent oxidoreductase [Chromatiales bacterium]